ncbi:MAG: glutamate 5-kinase [Desulfovibrio sp.]|jgi:glutamate 5-kinase|nr:glutamate 5-kinase [Desulfovibrio sp.]
MTHAIQDWREERSQHLANARTVLVKVGSAVVSGSHGLDGEVLGNLARQFALLRNGGDASRRVILVSSGAVSAGRAVLAERNMPSDAVGLAQRQAVAAVGQGRLILAWDEACGRHGMTTAQVLLTRDDLRARSRFLHVRNTFAELLDRGILPVVNENDTVSVEELRFGDNDCLASLLVNLCNADLFVNMTSASGVLAADPGTSPGAPVMECIEDVGALDIAGLCGSKTLSGTGGMHSKLMAARRAAQIGVPTLILPGREPDVLSTVLAGAAEGGKLPGTWVRPAAHAIPRRKFWMAYQTDPAGVVSVDEGAANALLHKGGSLLPGGVRQVEGNFQQGALVRIVHEGGNLGVGLSNYTAAQLRRIMGLKRHQVAAILGDAQYPEVVHRDNMLLDAAI